jgi:hypothetical protein
MEVAAHRDLERLAAMGDRRGFDAAQRNLRGLSWLRSLAARGDSRGAWLN